MLVEAVNWKDPSKPTLVLLLLSKDPVEEEFGCYFPILPTTELLKVLEALFLAISFLPLIDGLNRVRGSNWVFSSELILSARPNFVGPLYKNFSFGSVPNFSFRPNLVKLLVRLFLLSLGFMPDTCPVGTSELTEFLYLLSPGLLRVTIIHGPYLPSSKSAHLSFFVPLPGVVLVASCKLCELVACFVLAAPPSPA